VFHSSVGTAIAPVARGGAARAASAPGVGVGTTRGCGPVVVAPVRSAWGPVIAAAPSGVGGTSIDAEIRAPMPS
jgi:hypothetical protein